MLVTREWEPQVLGESLIRKRRLSRHVANHFPDFAGRFSTPDLQGWIEDNLKAAARYFQTEQGLTLYVDLACLLGEDFAADPELAFWVGVSGLIPNWVKKNGVTSSMRKLVRTCSALTVRRFLCAGEFAGFVS